MTLLCAISGITPQHSVVSDQGVLFEQTELNERLGRIDTCPLTGHVINERLLISVEKPPRFVHPSGVFSQLRCLPGIFQLIRVDIDRLNLKNVSIRREVRGILAEIAHLKTSRSAGELLIQNIKGEIEEAMQKRDSLARQIAQFRKESD
jgi:hypothetical protein